MGYLRSSQFTGAARSSTYSEFVGGKLFSAVKGWTELEGAITEKTFKITVATQGCTILPCQVDWWDSTTSDASGVPSDGKKCSVGMVRFHLPGTRTSDGAKIEGQETATEKFGNSFLKDSRVIGLKKGDTKESGIHFLFYSLSGGEKVNGGTILEHEAIFWGEMILMAEDEAKTTFTLEAQHALISAKTQLPESAADKSSWTCDRTTESYFMQRVAALKK